MYIYKYTYIASKVHIGAFKFKFEVSIATFLTPKTI